MPSTISITGTFSGGPVLPSLTLPQIVGTAVPQEQPVSLSSGANTITVPAGMVGCLFVPPAANGVQVTLKGVTGDTGVLIHLTNPTLISLGAGQSTFCLTAASTLSAALVWF